MTDAECRGSDWSKLGERDGIYGLRPQNDIYAHQCRAFQASVPEQPYMEGWTWGYAEYTRRVSSGEGASPP